MIFETVREAEVCADRVVNGMYGRVFDGYETPDYKIAYALSFLLAENRELNIHTEVEFNNDMEVYKVWITKHN
ncbi:hypothetical protein BK784_30360 [Bacillus thuringiensis serovar medellin]|uniref:Uncharacterized protein n=1 Tax=Bacillus thuringiensis subsp. medellin TaxID=79672 RepID=A0A9X6N2E8_BACTV|nr:hypothetical protein [Bacillus thuringiensis]OUB87377.1 hypothetical protein BK784_30360 [Bacillus thuringiensis serovar medellin]